jgi:molecular chaperone GrpE (heat shock protein)
MFIVENVINCLYFEQHPEKFEDTKRVIRSRNSKKDRQYNSQKKKYKRTNNDLQNTTQKTKIEHHEA